MAWIVQSRCTEARADLGAAGRLSEGESATRPSCRFHHRYDPGESGRGGPVLCRSADKHRAGDSDGPGYRAHDESDLHYGWKQRRWTGTELVVGSGGGCDYHARSLEADCCFAVRGWSGSLVQQSSYAASGAGGWATGKLC